jgi:post-segregation antitoxin (ccd killing protein)
MIMQGNWKQARQIGRAEARASDVLTVFRVRGIAVSDAARERILAEKDEARLERWHERAILAASIEDVLREPS